MTTLRVKDVTIEHFTTKTAHEGESLTVRMTGNADSLAHEGLEALLRQLDQEALRLKVKTATLDIHDLYFMNSSCLSLLVRWITTVAQRQPVPYSLRFASNPTLKWQRRSLAALAALAPSAVTVVSVAR